MAFVATIHNDEAALQAAIEALPGTASFAQPGSVPAITGVVPYGAKFLLIIDDATAGADGAGYVKTFNSPADLVAYLNTITLPPRFAIVDKGGGKFTFCSDTAEVAGVNDFGVMILTGTEEIAFEAEVADLLGEQVIWVEYGAKTLLIKQP